MERLEEFKEWEEPEEQEEPEESEELDTLTLEVCKEYRKRAKAIRDEKNPLQIGKRKELTEELQERYNIPEIWATNILNGQRYPDYLAILKKRRIDAKKNKGKEKEILIPFDEIGL